VANKPTGTPPTWATNSTYSGTGEAWESTPTRVTPSAGKIQNGFEPEEKPSAQTTNDRLGKLGDWITYYEARDAEPHALSAFGGSVAANWAANTGGYMASSGAGSYYYPLHMMRQADRLKSVEFVRYGDGAADLTEKHLNDNSIATLATLTVTNPAAAYATSRIKFDADTGPITITIDGTATIARSAGSFVDDGFVPGMSVTLSGFANAGNNTTKTIAASGVAATTLTFTNNTGFVVEAGTGDERAVAVPLAALAAGEAMQLNFAANATGLRLLKLFVVTEST
jgi:hypothetical protein